MITIEQFPFMVLVPETRVDETTMGEWLEAHEVEYVSRRAGGCLDAAYEFHFASQKIAETFARRFVG